MYARLKHLNDVHILYKFGTKYRIINRDMYLFRQLLQNFDQGMHQSMLIRSQLSKNF